MPNELQDAIGEAVTELQSFAGESFTFASTTFKAWPVDLMDTIPGRLPSAPDSTLTYEAVQATAPDFVNGSMLSHSSGNRRVGTRYKQNANGLFRFTLP